MNNSNSLGVLATLREVTELLAELDLPSLPPIASVQVHWDAVDMLGAHVQLNGGLVVDLERIDAIRVWAVAMGGVVLLGDAHYSAYSRSGYRPLSAIVRLPSGGLFEVWDHLTDLGTAPEWTTTDTGLIAA